MTWQQIDTAPKDGTRILVCTEGFLESYCVWRHIESNKWLEATDDMFSNEDEWNRYISSTYLNPTHWMPMPKPISLGHNAVLSGATAEPNDCAGRLVRPLELIVRGVKTGSM